MGAGDFPAGAGGAGYDPPYVPPAPVPPFLPRASFFDPSINQFLGQDEDGTNIDMHPVDQIMALRLTTLQGQSKSLTTLGTRLGIICARLQTAKLPQTAYNEVKSVVQDLIDNGDVILVSVTLDPASSPGKNIFDIAYVNLRDPKTNPRFPLTNTRSVSVVGVNP